LVKQNIERSSNFYSQHPLVYTFCILASEGSHPCAKLREWIDVDEIAEIYDSFIEPLMIDLNDHEENPQDNALYNGLGAINCQQFYTRIISAHRIDDDDDDEACGIRWDNLRYDVVEHVLYSSRSLAYGHICSGFNQGKAAVCSSLFTLRSIGSEKVYYMFKRQLYLLVEYDGKDLALKITFEGSNPQLNAQFQQLCIDSIGLLETKEAQQTVKAWTGSAMVFCVKMHYHLY
jgi:hypothetical protein